MLLFNHKGVMKLDEVYFKTDKYTGSYDNECFAPQFWGEDEKCIVITTLILTKSE